MTYTFTISWEKLGFNGEISPTIVALTAAWQYPPIYAFGYLKKNYMPPIILLF